MRHYVLAGLLGGVLLFLGGCVSQGGVKPAAKVDVVKQRFDAVWLSKHFEQAPGAEDVQTLVQQAKRKLKGAVQAKSKQDLAAVLNRQALILQLTLEKMNWQPLQFNPPMLVVQKAYTPASHTLDVQVEVDRVAWLKQLNKQLQALDQALLRFKRVPDQVNALLKLRAMVPALPLLLHRVQVREMIWRLAPDSAMTKQDRMADRLLYQLQQTSQDLVFEVDTDIEKKPAFERVLNAALLELGFKLLATRPADLFIVYEVKDMRVQAQKEGVKVTYLLNLKLSDADGSPFAVYPLEISAHGSTRQITTLRVMQKIADNIQRKVADYLLTEYKVFYLGKGASL